MVSGKHRIVKFNKDSTIVASTMRRTFLRNCQFLSDYIV
jgi:hypothetical protein